MLLGTRAVLDGETEAGVWFPEERGTLRDRRTLLQRSAEGCSVFALNKPTWALESDASRLGMGMYW